MLDPKWWKYIYNKDVELELELEAEKGKKGGGKRKKKKNGREGGIKTPCNHATNSPELGVKLVNEW